MKHLVVSTMVLSSLMLVGCGNSTEEIIEDAKEELSSYEVYSDEKLMDLAEGLNDLTSYEVVGFSLENRIVVINKSSGVDYASLQENFASFDAVLIQGSIKRVGLKSVTVYVEYYNENNEQIALLTVTKDDYSIEEVK